MQWGEITKQPLTEYYIYSRIELRAKMVMRNFEIDKLARVLMWGDFFLAVGHEWTELLV